MGRKAIAVNLSDIAAMGGRPVAAFVSVGLPRGQAEGLAEELYLGLCAEDPENDHLWTAVFRIHERTGSTLGLSQSCRKLRHHHLRGPERRQRLGLGLRRARAAGKRS